MTIQLKRCGWCGDDPLYQRYHDEEWGVPIFDDQKLFEFLILEGAQAGLSWITILRKRQNYLQAFDRLEPTKVALYDATQIAKLLQDKGIVRNKLKVYSAVSNAQRYLEIVETHGSFSDYLWRFVDGQPVINAFKTLEDVPVSTEQSNQMAKVLKKDGFKFVGTTICYAFMQATGMVNDHITDCHRYNACQ
ncbi:MAG: DNA-3-methyladenine glycosylase I [Pseudomonadales bacterium]|nr:DNA-3-methyladenine glycosylase I [Pseudomonadales bacterium]MDG1442592.1 DNA-3-methyladenine glycosylase I [Pseudomonadales bacterium]